MFILKKERMKEKKKKLATDEYRTSPLHSDITPKTWEDYQHQPDTGPV